MSYELEMSYIDSYIDIDTKQCDMEYCNELTEKNERYCLKCDKLLGDMYIEGRGG